MLQIAHVINPVKVSPQSDLFLAQPVTFETMRIAKEFAMGKVEVELYTTQYPEDREIIPFFFTMLDDLQESILTEKNFSVKRKLPFIREILGKLKSISRADYFIYTNADIALQPYFYLSVKHIIEQGYDGFFINRRTISKEYTKVEDIPLMYEQVGQRHPGCDCFVFKRENLENFKFGNAIIGASYFDKLFLLNLGVYSNKFTAFNYSHLTFHLGDDRVWSTRNFLEYDELNRTELRKFIDLVEKTEMIEDAYVKSQLDRIKYASESVGRRDISKRIRREMRRYIHIFSGQLNNFNIFLQNEYKRYKSFFFNE